MSASGEAMAYALYAAAALTIGIGIAHSWLGERYILTRLFRRDNLPQLFGGTAFTINTLRFAWHVTTIAWCGFAAILILIAQGPPAPRALGLVIGVTFLAHFAIALIASRGRHLSWAVFLAIGVLTLYATFT